MSKAEHNSHPTSDADKRPPEKGDTEKNNPAQNEFARVQLKKATEMATAFVNRLQPPPANPKAMIYDLVCHTLGGLIWTLQQTKSDMQRGYCKLSDRKEFVEIEQAHFDTIIHQHHPEYRGEPLPLTQSRADILIKEIVWRVNEQLGPLNKIKSDDARNDLLAEIDRFTKKTIARYTVEPFGEKEVVKEMAALQQLILRWIDRWQLPISPQNIAYHVHWAFKDYGETIRDFEGPLPPSADSMRPAEGIHYLESLIRRLEELGEQEYFAPDGNSDGDSETSRNDNKSDTRATRMGESAPGIDAMSAGPGWHFMRPPSNRQGRYEPADYYFNDADAKIIREWIPDFDADQAKFSDLQTLLRTEFGMPFDESLALNVRQIIDCLSRQKSKRGQSESGTERLNTLASRSVSDDRADSKSNSAGSALASSPVLESGNGKLSADPKPSRQRGRLNKDDSKAKRASLLATIRQHPSLKDDPAKLGGMVGVSESTARRWLNDEEKKYRESRAANPEPVEE